MSLVRKVERAEGKVGVDLTFWCPACKCAHGISTREPGPVWAYDGREEAPTITPSVRVQWADEKGPVCCHSVITVGLIRFCDDCTHWPGRPWRWWNFQGMTVRMDPARVVLA